VITSEIQVFDSIKVEVFGYDLEAMLTSKGNNEAILKVADDVLAEVQGDWHPRAIIRWLPVEHVGDGTVILRSMGDGTGGTKAAVLHLGYSSRFMKSAQYSLVGVFTAGDELEKKSIVASRHKQYMDAYLYDLIGMVVLEKTRQQINVIVEEKALELHWGIGPFLSPGSVHGWELDDQENLCALLPLDRIGVTGGEAGIFKPFKTLSCLISIGSQFSSKKVGSPCDVCSNKKQCDMRAHAQ